MMAAMTSSLWIAFVALWAGGRCSVIAPQHEIKSSSSLPGGWRCCEDDHIFCGEASSGNTAGFSPPLHNFENLSLVSKEIVWSYRPLKCPKGFRQTSYDLDGNQNSLVLRDEGVALRWLELVSKDTEDYCVTYTSQGGYQAITCRPDTDQICNDVTCIQKCCDVEEVMSLFEKCVKRQDRGFSPEFRSLRGDPVGIPKDLQIIAKVPHCESIIMFNPQKEPSDKYLILPNGHLYHPANDQYYSIDNYCIDELIEWSAPMALVCNEVRDMTKIHLQTGGVVVSLVFLTVTIVCHIVVPKLRDMQGLCLLCHMVSLFVADGALFVSYVYTYKDTGLACVINGMIIQMSFLATFFWLNVMCFDIWRVIRATVNLVPLTGILSDDSKKYKVYSVYAWGGPFVVTSISALLHFLPDRFVAVGVVRPDFGVNNCFLHAVATSEQLLSHVTSPDTTMCMLIQAISNTSPTSTAWSECSSSQTYCFSATPSTCSSERESRPTAAGRQSVRGHSIAVTLTRTGSGSVYLLLWLYAGLLRCSPGRYLLLRCGLSRTY
ncbi:uncharacterized protein LOC122257268 isoform X2 [Penaeus japonicus]|uniref:uncharacterized protein LOC122257268 isoform X2 n=1 Tax=Penaeus japonicus TaxID=27405 RepID=UPI001C70F897|nr:uncharacterized protein LOC122257268 isoform X2 [Penaeus japonicus]